MPFNLRGPELLILLFLLLIVAAIVLVVVFVVKAVNKPSPTGNVPSPSRPPGWYPVPDGSGRVAWWDGEKWADPPPPA